MELEKILEKLVGFNTVLDKENEKIILWLENFLQELGFATEIISDAKTGKKTSSLQPDRIRKMPVFFWPHGHGASWG